MTAGISDDIPALFSLSFALGEYNGTIPGSNEKIRKHRRKRGTFMKIAVMTWFHYDNYGTVLQAASLVKLLREFGHEAEIIDYFPQERVLRMPPGSSRAQFIRRFRRLRNNDRTAKNPVITTQVSGEAFERFRKDHLPLTDYCATLTDLERLNDRYDAFVCGSDRIWLPMYFDPRFFLDFVHDPLRMIAYAPSILDTGETDEHVLKKMQELIGRFTHLSVREEEGRHFLGESFGKKTKEPAAPLLLVDKEEWGSRLQLPGEEEEHYLLAVFQGDNRSYWDAAEKLAARLELKLRIIPVRSLDLMREGAVTDPIGPVDYISMIRNADYICTDSYHATLLSLLFEKQFCSFERYAGRENLVLNRRIRHILSAVSLSSRLYAIDAPLERYLEAIDYIPVNYKINALKITSREFMQTSLDAVAAHVQETSPAKRHILQGYELCSGCGACTAACEQSALQVVRQDDGFLRAVVEEEKCIRCERCRMVCPFQNEQSGKNVAEGWLLSYQDEEDAFRQDASAGALCSRLERLLHKEGRAVAGCVFDEQTQTALHTLVLPEDDQSGLDAHKGSKHMPGDFSGALNKLKEYSGPAAIFGLPCQIEGARKLFWDRNDILYIEIVCGGVPSYLLYEKYKRSFKGRARLNSDSFALAVSYRQLPGQGRFVKVTDGAAEKIIPRKKDAFTRVTDSGVYFGEACYECRWRDRSSADLRIGDYRFGLHSNEETSQSICICMTPEGRQLLNHLMTEGYWEGLHKLSMEEYLTKMPGINPPRPVFYEELSEKFQDEKMSLHKIINEYVKPFE